MRYLFLLLTFLLALPNQTLASKASNTKSLTPITLQLLWKHQFEFAGFYAAKAKGFYEEVGLNVHFRELSSNQDPTEEVISGRAQFGINDSTLLIDRSQGKPVVLLSNIFQHSPMVLIAKSDSGISSPAHMVGKKVMLGTNIQSNASIIAMLKKESVSLSDIQVVPHSFNTKALEDNTVDVMSAYMSNQTGTFANNNIPINIISPINYAIDFYGNNIFTSEHEIKNYPQRTKNFVQASLKGWLYALEHPEEITDLILQQYSQKKSKADLLFEAKSLKEYILPNFIPIGTIESARLQSNIKTYQQLNLIDPSFSLDGFLSQHYEDAIEPIFTPQELAWIKQKKQIILGVDPSWQPFEFIDDDNKFSGMSADFMHLIAQKTGLEIIVQDNKTWRDVIFSAQNKHLDVLPAVKSSPQRKQYLDFSKPYIRYPMVIVTEKNSPFISELSELNGKKVVVVNGYVTEDLINTNYPKINLLTAIDLDEALSFVSNGDADAFVDNLVTTTTAISSDGYSNLRISGTTQYHFDLSMAVLKGEKMLLNILQKALDDISPEEKNRIKNKWISLHYTQSVDYSVVYQIVVLALIVLTAVIFWNRRLSKEIHHRKMAEQSAKESEKRFRMLFEGNKAAELISDPISGDIIKANPAAVLFYGYSLEELTSLKIQQINTLTPLEIEQEIANALQQQRSYLNFKHRLANGNIRDVEVHSGPVEWDNRQLLYSIIHDVTKQKQLQLELSVKASELEYQATHDALTGLINRREFEHRLYKAIAFCKKEGSCNRSVMALDLDNFKVINDTAGHAIGDKVLIEVGQLMSSKVRTRDTFARLGGDEFGILLDNCSLQDAEEIASSIIEAVKNFHFKWNDSTFHLGVSIGLSAIDCRHSSMDDILNNADAACYEAKRLGRNRYQIFSDENIEFSKRKGERWWTNEIFRAIEENRFTLFHQTILPISTSNQHEGAQFEVLLRLHDNEGLLVLPNSFIPAAERYHLMPTIDLWVIDHAFDSLATTNKDIHKCSINLSGQSFASDGFYDEVMKKFKHYGIKPDIICWEITETAAIAGYDKAKVFITKMRQFGCSFSLDDFGSGLSSFAYLKHLEVDFIKIDGSLVKEILSNPKDQLIIESIQNISQGLGMKTIAEFVENDDIKQQLMTMGIDYAQGYGIHKPSPLK